MLMKPLHLPVAAQVQQQGKRAAQVQRLGMPAAQVWLQVPPAALLAAAQGLQQGLLAALPVVLLEAAQGQLQGLLAAQARPQGSLGVVVGPVQAQPQGMPAARA